MPETRPPHARVAAALSVTGTGWRPAGIVVLSYQFAAEYDAETVTKDAETAC